MRLEHYTLRASKTKLVRFGYTDTNLLTSDFDRRELLTIGSYEPNSTNSGPLSDTPRTVVNQNYTLTVAGTILKNLDIYGTVDVQAANCVVQNCAVRGTTTAPSGERGLIMSTNSNVKNLLVVDTLLQPQTPHYRWNGITGHDYIAKRVITRNTTDGFGVFNTSSPGGVLSVEILGCWVDKMVYWSNDGGIHTDGTHNDAVQIQGGTGLKIIGCRLDAYLNTAFGQDRTITDTWSGAYNKQALSAIMINNNSGVGPTSALTVLSNYIRGGDIGINAGADNLGGYDLGLFHKNKFDRGARLSTSDGQIYSLSIDVNTIIDLGSGTNVNTYIDNGAIVPRKNG